MDPWVHPSVGWTPARSHHGCSNQCLLLGTHGCTFFHWKDSSVDPSVLHPMLSPWDPWVLLLPWDGHQHGATIGAPTSVCSLGPMGASSSIGRTPAWTHWCSTLCSACGTHGCTFFYGKDTRVDPWVLPSMGWTAGWSHHWCSNECLPLGTHGCTLLHWKDTRVDPWVHPLPLEGHSMDPWVHPLPWDGHQHRATIGAPTAVCPLGPMGAPSSTGRTQHGSTIDAPPHIWP